MMLDAHHNTDDGCDDNDNTNGDSDFKPFAAAGFGDRTLGRYVAG